MGWSPWLSTHILWDRADKKCPILLQWTLTPGGVSNFLIYQENPGSACKADELHAMSHIRRDPIRKLFGFTILVCSVKISIGVNWSGMPWIHETSWSGIPGIHELIRTGHLSTWEEVLICSRQTTGFALRSCSLKLFNWSFSPVDDY